MKSGQLIVFEGPDGVGKTTLSQLLVDELNRRGHEALWVSFPGREPGTLGGLVNQLHHRPEELGVSRISEAARQALHVAAHLDAVASTILPALRSGVSVILDRYWWSTLVYGEAGGIDRRLLEKLIEAEGIGWEGTRPSLGLVLRRREPLDRDVDLLTWKSLMERYEALASEEGATIVDNEGEVSQTLRRIMECLGSPELPQAALPEERPAIGSPRIWIHLAPAKPTPVLETYWHFAAERQEIFFRRVEGQEEPWTTDPVLRKHKFTNAFRASDRVSQYLIRRVIYRADLPDSEEEVVFRILLFKLFNKIDTWETLEECLGGISWRAFDASEYDRVLAEQMASGKRIYSAAYIMPPGGSAYGYASKHRNHLALLVHMMEDRLPERLQTSGRMQDAFDALRAYPTIGDFLAYQFVTDINYSRVTNFSEMEFVVPGPGARDGLRKCFFDLGGLSESEMIRLLADTQEEHFERLGIAFKTLWGRRLQLIDCQNLFCEVGKYARVVHPDVLGLSGRTRIKQTFSAHRDDLTLWYPPKWGINDKIPARFGEAGHTAFGLSKGAPSQGPTQRDLFG